MAIGAPELKKPSPQLLTKLGHAEIISAGPPGLNVAPRKVTTGSYVAPKYVKLDSEAELLASWQYGPTSGPGMH
eukprot:4566491-Amphidinium_carterae.2